MRATVIYSLVLGLVAGPLLCCCTGARLAHAAPAGPPAPLKSCCGEAPKPSDPHQPPADHHAPCPCKGAAATPALSEPATGTDSFTLPAAGPAAFDAVPTVGLLKTTAAHPTWHRPALSAADLLFVHHNLRC